MSKEINTIKIKMISTHPEYKKGEIYDLEEKIAVALLTNGKAIKIHRKIISPAIPVIEKTEEKIEEKIEEKTDEKIDAKKSKKNETKE